MVGVYNIIGLRKSALNSKRPQDILRFSSDKIAKEDASKLSKLLEAKQGQDALPSYGFAAYNVISHSVSPRHVSSSYPPHHNAAAFTYFCIEQMAPKLQYTAKIEQFFPPLNVVDLSER